MNSAPVLVVDDNHANLKLLRVILEAEGYDVRCACTGEDALAMLDSVDPRAFLLDVHLPGMDGLEVARRIRAHPQHHRTPIIAVTASAGISEKPSALAAGCDVWLTKPFDADVLLCTLATLLAAAGGGREPPPSPVDPDTDPR